MATWKEIGLDSLAAARELLAAGHWRSGVSRCYFAAYARVTVELLGRTSFRPGYEAPTHAALPDNVIDYVSWLPYPKRLALSTTVETLYVMRLEADYQASICIAREFAAEALKAAESVFETLRESERKNADVDTISGT